MVRTLVFAVLRSPMVVGILLAGLFGVCIAGMPLFNVLGFEYSFAASIFISVCLGPLANWQLAKHPDIPLAQSFSKLCGLAFAMLAMLLGLAFLNELRVGACNTGFGLLCFLLNPVASAAFALSIVATLALIAKRTWLRQLLYVAVACGFIFATIAKMLHSPAIFCFDFFFGYFPGSIYDEVLSIEPPFAWFRVYTLVSGIVLFLSVYFAKQFAQERSIVLPMAREKRLFALYFALAFGWFTFFAFQEQFGFYHSADFVQRALGARKDSPHFIVWHSKAPDMERRIGVIVDDLEFRYDQIVRELHTPEKAEKVTVYLFSSPEEKGRLTGASNTLIGNFFTNEIYLHALELFHPAIKHELAHVLGNRINESFLGAPFDMCLIEGFAVAVAWSNEEQLDPHQLSCAMQKKGAGLDIEGIGNPLSFWAKQSTKAYTQCGSFVRFLLTTYGVERVKRLYAGEAVQTVYSKPLDVLVKEWQRFLDGMTVPVAKEGIVEAAIAQRSMFERRCAREVAALSDSAWSAFDKKHYEDAKALFTAAYVKSGEQHRHLKPLIQLAVQRRVFDEAETLIAAFAKRPELSSVDRLFMTEWQAKLAFLKGNVKAAQEGFLALRRLGLSADQRRKGLFYLLALPHPEHHARLAQLITGEVAAEGGIRELLTKLANLPTSQPSALYLLGLMLFHEGKYLEAGDALSLFERTSWKESEFYYDALLTLGKSRALAGRYRDASVVLALLGQATSDLSLQGTVKDWQDRVAWEAARKGIGKLL